MNWNLESLKEVVTNGFDEQNAALRDFLATFPPLLGPRNDTPANTLLPISRVPTYISNMSMATTLRGDSNSVTTMSKELRLIQVQLPQYRLRKCHSGCKCGCHIRKQQRIFP
jgi:hypothetical protein